jgi:hypothetical protein
MWRIEYSKLIKLKEKFAIIWRNDWQGYDVFGNDDKYSEDKDVVQTQI